MASEIKVDTISNAAGSGPSTLIGQSAAKAWHQYNQSTPAIADSFNTSSITDVAVGNHTANFTSAMANDDYSYSGSGETGGVAIVWTQDSATTPTTTALRGETQNISGTASDRARACLTTHGDLA